MEEFNKNNIQIIAVSCDTREKAAEFAEDLKLSFNVGYGLNAKKTSEVTGAFYNDQQGHLHATGFIVKPHEVIMKILYSEGTYDRFKAKECLNDIAKFEAK